MNDDKVSFWVKPELLADPPLVGSAGQFEVFENKNNSENVLLDFLTYSPIILFAKERESLRVWVGSLPWIV